MKRALPLFATLLWGALQLSVSANGPDPNDAAAALPAPVLRYSSFLGGSSFDSGAAITFDSAGNLYVAGSTLSNDFPGSRIGGATGGWDAFVCKFARDGSLAYATRLGGSGDDFAYGISVDEVGRAYIAGSTASADFPVTSNGFQTRLKGPSNAIAAVLEDNGSALTYSTFLGGSSSDSANGIAVNGLGKLAIAGVANSRDFPVTPQAFQKTPALNAEAFVSVLDISKTGVAALVYSTYLGGSANEGVTAVRMDATGNLHAAGFSESGDFPTTANAFQPSNGGSLCTEGFCYDAFFVKLNPALSGAASLLYSTYLGGGLDDHGYSLEIDDSGNAYLAGQTEATDFPVTAGALQTHNAGDFDAFVAKINPAALGAASLVYATYLGGGSADFGTAIAVDATGHAYVGGYTYSTDFPALNAVQGSCASCAGASAASDGFVAELDPAGGSLLSSTYLGGEGEDYARAVAWDRNRTLVVAGETFSSLFPVTRGAADRRCGANGQCGEISDGFAAKIMQSAQPGFSIASSPLTSTIHAGQSASYRVTLAATGDFSGRVHLACVNSPPQSQCAVAPPSVVLNPGAVTSTTATVNTSSAIPPGTYTPNFAGANAGKQQHLRVLLVVK